jgi:hypothetical protein
MAQAGSVDAWHKLGGAVTGLRLYAAPRGRASPISTSPKHFPGAENTASGCVHVNGSQGFYLDIHSTEFPNGAIPGQLG